MPLDAVTKARVKKLAEEMNASMAQVARIALEMLLDMGSEGRMGSGEPH